MKTAVFWLVLIVLVVVLPEIVERSSSTADAVEVHVGFYRFKIYQTPTPAEETRAGWQTVQAGENYVNHSMTFSLPGVERRSDSGVTEYPLNLEIRNGRLVDVSIDDGTADIYPRFRFHANITYAIELDQKKFLAKIRDKNIQFIVLAGGAKAPP